MTLLNNGGAGGGAGGASGGEAGADDNANKGGTGGGVDENANGGAGSDSGDENFDVNAIGDDMKNPEVYKDGKFFGKYKSLGEVGKGLKELTGKMVNGSKAPDKYDFSKVKVEGHDDLKVDLEDPMSKAILPLLKKHNISQEAADDLAQAYLSTTMAGMVDPDKEFASLGKDGPAMVDNIRDVLKDADAETRAFVEEATKTAAGVRAMNWALGKQVRDDTPVPGRANGAPQKSAAELKSAAFAYKDQHKNTIEGDETQQGEYNRMMHEAMQAEENEAKRKK